MSDDLIELRNAFDLAVRGSRRRGRLPGRLGYQGSGGAWVFDVPGWPGYTFVRLGMNADAESVTLAKAINHSVGKIPDLPVWVERNDEGIFVVTGVRTVEYLSMSGGTLTGATVGPHTHEPGGGMVDPVSERRITAGLAYATGSGLLIGVKPFSYRHAGIDKKFTGATINIAGHLPSSGYWRWVKICLDPDTNALVALAGDPISLNTILTDAMLDGILATDYIPLAGVKLKAGASSLDESLIVDRRPWWSVVDADAFHGGSTLWDADQFPAIPAAEDDEFNDGALAAKWTEYDSGSLQTVSESGSILSLSQAEQANEILTGLYQTLPSGDFTLASKIALNADSPSGPGVSWQAGLALWENAASDAAAAVLIGPYADYAGGAERKLFSWTRFSSRNVLESSLADDIAEAWAQAQYVYVRIRRSGTTYYADFSQDGEAWRTMQFYPEFTPQHCGLALFNKASGQIITCAADFFRRRAQADSNLDPVFGGVYLETTRLTELGDVDLETTAPSDGNVLLFDEASGQWIAGEGGSAKPLLLWTFAGNLGVGANPLRIYNTASQSFQIQKVFLSVSTPSAGASVIVDVHKNGTTIFTTQANRPQVAEGQYTGQSTAIDVTSWGVGEYLTVEVDQVGTTVPGADLTVQVAVSEISGGGGGSGSDTTAIHANAANEIASLTEKITPISSDILVIEDSAASNAKKKVQIGNLPLGAGSLDDLSDVDLTTTPPSNGNALTYDEASGLWIPGAGGGGGGGASSFLDLTDTPNSYTGQAGKVAVVNATEDGLEFTDVSLVTNLSLSGAKVRLSSAHALTSGSWTTIGWSIEDYDTGGYWDSSSPTRFTIPSDGVYIVTFYATVDGGGERSINILLNGSTAPFQITEDSGIVGGGTNRQTLTGVLKLSVGDYLQVQVYQNSGTQYLDTASSFTIQKVADTIQTPMARVWRSTNQTIPNNTDSALSFDTEQIDTGNFWNSSNPTRFTVSESGVYLIHCCARFETSSGSGQHRCLKLRVNGSTNDSVRVNGYGGDNVRPEMEIHGILQLNAGDYVEVYVYQDTGGNVDMLSFLPNGWPIFSIVKL